MRIALVNTNRVKPPVAPIGLDYIAEALNATGHSTELLDLCWEEDVQRAIAAFFSRREFGLIGMTLRNTDDCAFSSRHSFLDGFLEMVQTVREHSGAPIVLGGVGFSVIPELILSQSRADFGVWGEGEFTMTALAARLEEGSSCVDLPNLIWRDEGIWRRNPPEWRSLDDLPAMSRSWIDNRRYFREGGQAGFETKRGCSSPCTFCADPVAKGKRVRLRPAAAVANELERLLDQGIDTLHTCDGEFNIPEWHALAVCEEIVRRGLGDKLRWYAYCAPTPFSPKLAGAMRRAGCQGIDFGADHADQAMLKRLGRDFNARDILNATRWTKEAGMAVMLDLLLGAPGETREGIQQTVDIVKQANPDRAGVSLGVRIFPGTELAAELGSIPTADPVYFLEPGIESEVFGWLSAMIGEDERFLFFDPTKPAQNYNYNSNQRLVDAIAKGYRGAFWDILRRCRNEPSVDA